MKFAIFQTVKSKVIISLFETLSLSVSISLRNLYNSLKSIKEIPFLKRNGVEENKQEITKVVFYSPALKKWGYTGFGLLLCKNCWKHMGMYL